MEKTMGQAKKKLRYLKDRYKEAAVKNKRSGGARNVPMYYDIFDEVYGTRSLVTMNEVRETEENPRAKVDAERAINEKRKDLNKEDEEDEEAQPKRTKKKSIKIANSNPFNGILK
eukprot:gene2005-2280_t